MELYILRHADAVNVGEGGCTSDRERFLSEEGRRSMGIIAKNMESLEVKFDVLLSSPYIRARQTAEIVARTLRAEKKLKISNTLSVGAGIEDLMFELKEHQMQHDGLFLVGHEPQLSQLISFLLAGHQNLNIEMKKAGFCKLFIERFTLMGSCGVLNWLLAPKHLKRMSSSL